MCACVHVHVHVHVHVLQVPLFCFVKLRIKISPTGLFTSRVFVNGITVQEYLSDDYGGEIFLEVVLVLWTLYHLYSEISQASCRVSLLPRPILPCRLLAARLASRASHLSDSGGAGVLGVHHQWLLDLGGSQASQRAADLRLLSWVGLG